MKGKLGRGEITWLDLWTSVNGTLAYLEKYNEHKRVLELRRLFYRLFGFSCEHFEEFRKREQRSMEYIVTKRYKRDNALGRFNLPRGTTVQERDGWLYHNGRRICSDHSAVMREYFARNDDGDGLKRSEWTGAVVKAMQIRPGESKDAWNARWEPLWQDAVCNKYRKDPSDTTFLWSVDFFNAPLLDLYHIAALAGVKKGKKTA